MHTTKPEAKSSYRPFIAAALSAILFAVGAPGLFAQSVGVNFANGGDHINNSAGDSMAASATAGAPPYAQANWNNLGRYGDSVTLYDANGNATGLSINWDSTSTASAGTLYLGTGDGELMDGFLYPYSSGTATPLANSVYGSDVVDKPLVYLGGLNAWCAASGAQSYAIVLYINGYSYWGEGERWIQSVSGNPLSYSMVAGADLTPHIFSVDSAGFWGNYVQATSTLVGSPTYGANYEVFTGLTNDAVLIRGANNGNYGANALNGFQIIPIFAASAPAVSTPVFSPSASVYADSPVALTEVATGSGILSYQWQSDGGSGGALTDIPGATASNWTVIPPDTGSGYAISYDVIVTNTISGVPLSATSQVATLNVSAATAAFLTRDTAPGLNVFAYVGGTVNYSAAFDGTMPIAYLWQSNSVNIPNATNATLVLTNIQMAASLSTFQLTATNSVGGTVSSPSTLNVLADPPAPSSGQPYAYAVFTNHPLAYWRFSETADNSGNTIQAYDYSGNGYDATYGSAAHDNQTGPRSPAFGGFEAGNTGVAFSHYTPNSFVLAPSLNLNTNTVTITAWIYPDSGQAAYNGLFTWANGMDKAGFGFGGVSSNGMAELGYTWNTNNPGSYGYNSGLFPPAGQWSFVALAITPTNSALYLYYIDSGAGVTNLLKSVQSVANGPEAFSGGAIWIGSDTYASRTFGGSMDEVAVFARSLSEADLGSLFLAGLGAAGVAPVITANPAPATINTYVGQTIRLAAGGDGAPQPAYQWQYRPAGSGVGSFAGVQNGGRISGANSGVLVITNAIPSDGTDYQLVVSNVAGSATSSVATVTLTPVPNNGVWTVNFAAIAGNNSAPTVVYRGRGVLGSGAYWNALHTGGQYANSTSLLDDGSTATGIGVFVAGAFNGGNWFSGYPMQNALLDPYWNCNGAFQVVFTNLLNGTYNLAAYGIDGAYPDAACTGGTSFTVNGVTISLVNHQDLYFTDGDNTALFANVQVTDGGLVLGLSGNNQTEADFDGAQLQLVQAVGNPALIGGVRESAGNLVITGTSPDSGAAYRILTTTNIALPLIEWTPVATNTFLSGGFTNSFPINPAHPQSFYQVVEP